jgi:hypothetical protein
MKEKLYHPHQYEMLDHEQREIYRHDLKLFVPVVLLNRRINLRQIKADVQILVHH